MSNDNPDITRTTSPVMTQEAFAEASGLTPDTVRGLIAKGMLASFKLGKRRMVNLAVLQQQCLAEANLK